MNKATQTTAKDLLISIQSDWSTANSSNAKYYVGLFRRCRTKLLQIAVAEIAQRRTSTAE